MSRRDALRLGAAAAATAGAASAFGGRALASDEGLDGAQHRGGGGGRPPTGGEYDDVMFDVAAVVAGGHWISPYGPDDQRGAFNEVTPERTATALSRLNRGRPVNTYQLGEEMFNGFPAFPSDPPRLHESYLYVLGYDAGPEFAAGGGIQTGTTPIGPNAAVVNEERFVANFTFQIGSQIDGLNHVGIGTNDERLGRFYNDHYAADFITPTGTTVLGNETMGPIVTRGVIVDVVGLKVATGQTDTFFVAPDGQPVLNDSYRITIDDIENALHRQRVKDGFGPGDVPIIHTGWTHLVRSDPARYLAQEPGIYLAEARYFVDRRVAMIATDTWGLEVLDPAVTEGNAFPVHQELFGRTGTRIGESFVSDAAIADHAYDGVVIATPENAPGLTAGSSAPAFLGQPGRAPR